MFKWYKGSACGTYATIYDTNITLNKQASLYLENDDYCLLGADLKNRKIAIKPISDRDLKLKLYEHEELNNVYKGVSYTRISNKAFIKELQDNLNISFNGQKFKATYDDKERMLVVELDELAKV